MVANANQSPFSPATHGVRLESAPLGHFIATETAHVSGLELPWHRHQHACVTFVTAGCYTEDYGGREHTCTPGTLLFKPAGVKHRDRYGETGARSVIYQLPTDGDFDSLAPTRPRSMRGPMVGPLARRMYDEFRIRDNLSPLVVDGLLRTVLGLCQRENADPPRGTPPAWLAQVLEQLHDDFRPAPTIQSLAVLAGVHPDHLSRVFKRYCGSLIGDYVRSLQVEWAREQLKSPNKTLSQIALEAGFCDQSHFTRVFRARIGTTPGRYRAAHAPPTAQIRDGRRGFALV